MSRCARVAALVAAEACRSGEGGAQHLEGFREPRTQADPEQSRRDQARARTSRHRVHRWRRAGGAVAQEEEITCPLPTPPPQAGEGAERSARQAPLPLSPCGRAWRAERAG